MSGRTAQEPGDAVEQPETGLFPVLTREFGQIWKTLAQLRDDLRDVGSGNVGASNVLRTSGVAAAVLVEDELTADDYTHMVGEAKAVKGIPGSGSKRSTALSRPRLATWSKSSKDSLAPR